MARENRPQPGVIVTKASESNVAEIAALEKILQQQPYKFGFYQVLRRFECLYPQKPKIGTSLRPVNDVLRLVQEPTMAFSPATLNSFKIAKKGLDKESQPAKLAVNFFGMFGPNGPLPLHLTEYARDRLRNADDPTFSEFLNIFHHRMLSLFYRSWASAQPTVNFDRPKEDRFSTYTGALFGLGMPSLRDRDEIPDRVKLQKFRLILGPLNIDEYERFLPGRESGKRLRAMVRNYVGDSMNWDVNLVLKKEKVIPIKLGENDLLGWNTWLGDRVRNDDANDLLLEPMSAMI